MKNENYGIASSKRAMSKNDEKALQILDLTTKFFDGHYEIGLLWKENAKLPNNRWLSEKQLKQLNKKLSTKPDLQSKYEETLLSTVSTINCIRRFISRHGKPRKFLSANGKSFVSSCSELKKGIEALKASNEFASKLHILDIEIEWKFNPLLAPNFGGT